MLEDHASTTMGNIAKKAAALDAALAGLDDRLGILDNSQDNMATNWERRSKRMSREFRQDINSMRTEMTGLNTFMGGFDRKKVLTVDADTTRAIAKIRAVHALAERNATMGLGARGGMGSRAMGIVGGGGIAGMLGGAAVRRQGTQLGRMFGGLAQGAQAFGSSLDRVGVNLGPISARLSTLPLLLGALSGPLLATAAAGVTTLAGAVSALSAGLVGVTSLTGAFVFGIASIAIPATLAGKRIADANKELGKAQAALDKAKVGTVAYTRAQKRLKAAKDALSETDMQLIKNTGKLKSAWDKQIMQGKSGRRVVSMMNEAVLFGAKQMPWVASMFDRFTLSGDRLFKLANRNAPRFKRQMFAATDEWPKRFEEGGKAAGHLAMGFLGVIEAAEPFTEWMSDGLLKGMERFDKWANGSGQKGIAGWLKDMQPVLSSLGRLTKQTGGSIIDLSRRDQDDIIYFIDELTRGMEKLPGFIDKWSSRFRRMWPTMKGIFVDLGDFIEYTWKGFEDIEGAVDGLAGPLGKVHDVVKRIWGVMPEGLGLLLLGGLATKGGRTGLFGLARGIGSLATNLGRIPLGKTRTLGNLLRAIPGASKAGGLFGKGAGKVAGPVDSIVSMFEIGMPVTIVGNSPINPVWVAIAGSINLPFTKMGGRVAPRGGVPRTSPGGVAGPARTSGAARRIPGANDGVSEGARATRNGKIVYPDAQVARQRGLLARGLRGAVTKGNIAMLAGGMLIFADSAGAGEDAYMTQRRAAAGVFSTTHGDPMQFGPRGIRKDRPWWDTQGQHDVNNHNLAVKRRYRDRFKSIYASGGTEANKDRVDSIASGMTPGGQNFLRSMMPKGEWDFAKFIRSKGAVQLTSAVNLAVHRAMRDGTSTLNVGGVEMVLAYNTLLDQIETRRVDLSGFFADMGQKFRDGVAALGGIVQSVTGPLDTFWNKLTGGGGGAPAATPAAATPAGGGQRRTGPAAGRSRGHGKKAGDSQKGSGIMSKLKGGASAIGGVLSAGGDLVSRAINWLMEKGTAGRTTASGIGTMQDALNNHLATQFSSGGGASANGLLPQASALMQQLAAMFGVKLTSGFRPGAITESGNLSLHGMGRAIDVGGTAAQMQAVWNYLLGKGGIDELIYAGQIAENGGPPRPYGGADKHYDHVHVGIGDSSRGSGVAAVTAARAAGSSVTVSMAGAIIHIHTEADYEAFIERMANDIDRAVNSTGVSAGEMLDA